MLSKKYYTEIAKLIRKNIYTQTNDGFKYLSLEQFLEDLITLFKADNPNFDAIKFREAGGRGV